MATKAEGKTEPISLEERLARTEERLAAALEAIAAQGARADAREEAATSAGRWDSLAQAQALSALHGTVSDRLEGDTLLSEIGEHPVTFISKGVNFKAVRVPRQRTTAPNGEIQVSRGVTYDFAPNGTYTAETVEAVTHLRGLGSYNREFWELGREPHAAPDPDLVLRDIMEALSVFDDDRLAAIEELERASHQRDAVLKAVAHARRTAQGAVQREPEPA